jgi:hypothetical protein
MSLRRYLVVALTLAAGMALGYGASVSAQLTQSLPTPDQQRTVVSIESTGQNRFRVTVTDDGQTQTFEGEKITFSFVAAR